MLRRPTLDPRYYRLDDLLRRPLLAGTPLGSGGGDLWIGDSSGWGFDGGADYRGVTITAPLSWSLWIEGTPIFPVDGIYCPSHISMNAQDPETGLQINETKFVTDTDVLVSVISLRNPGEWSVDVEIRVQWGIARGEHQDATGNLFYVSRFAPNLQDRRFTLASGARTTVTLALAVSPDDRYAQAPGWTARQRAEACTRDPAIVLNRAESFQRWVDRHTPRFDCPDPWCLRSWYHDCHLQMKYPDWSRPAVDTTVTSLQAFVNEAHRRFTNNNFDQPEDQADSFLPDVFVESILGIRSENRSLSFSPVPDLAQWQFFCIENYALDDRVLTVVWDDPSASDDMYDDGDKGLSVYDRDVTLHKQSTLEPFAIELPEYSHVQYRDEDD